MGLINLRNMLNGGATIVSAPITLLKLMSDDFGVPEDQVFEEVSKKGTMLYIVGENHPEAAAFGGMGVMPDSDEFEIITWVGYENEKLSFEGRPATEEEIEEIRCEEEDTLVKISDVDPDHCDICKAISEGKSPCEAIAELVRSPDSIVIHEDMPEDEKDALLAAHDGPVVFTNCDNMPGFDPEVDIARPILREKKPN